MVDEWYSLVDPEDYFDAVNVSIHGIGAQDVKEAPTFRQATEELERRLGGQIVVTHTYFDRVAMHHAAARYALSPPTCRWLGSAKVARRTWEDCARSGYGPSDLCKRISCTFEHHHALADAKARGHVLLAALPDSDLDLEAALKRVIQPIDPAAAKIVRERSPDGTLAGEAIVFTGARAIPRRKAADLAASVGCEVADGVTKKKTLLVVGDMDIRNLAGHDKSSKHRKAEELAARGQPLRIIRASEFRDLVAQG